MQNEPMNDEITPADEFDTNIDLNAGADTSTTLQATLDKYHIEIPADKVEQLDHFCHLLWSWNTKINLTRHTTYEKFVTRDLLDSLAFAEFLAPGEKVLDVGSGSGVPGIVIGILRPDVSMSLVECVGKKARVLSEIIHELHLPIPVYEALGQEILGYWEFHTLLFRAVASMKKLLEWFRGTWVYFDRMLLVKGPNWVKERGEARHYSLLKGLALRKLKEYTIPGELETSSKADGTTTDGDVEASEAPEPSEQSESSVPPEAVENPTLADGVKSVILQICPEEKLGKDSLCILTAWENSKARKPNARSKVTAEGGRTSSRRSNNGDTTPRGETKKQARVEQSHRVSRIRSSTQRKNGRRTSQGDEE